jgi:hypothetical protein
MLRLVRGGRRDRQSPPMVAVRKVLTNKQTRSHGRPFDSIRCRRDHHQPRATPIPSFMAMRRPPRWLGSWLVPWPSMQLTESRPLALQTDNAWPYTHDRTLAELLALEGFAHRTIPARTPQAQWQGRALSANAQARVGPRTAVPLLRRSRGSAAALASPLQHGQEPQRDRYPAGRLSPVFGTC